jgi:hypothetical protein
VTFDLQSVDLEGKQVEINASLSISQSVRAPAPSMKLIRKGRDVGVSANS